MSGPGRGVPALEVRHLRVTFHTDEGDVHAVDEASFELYPGEVLGLVGESGSGKSVTALTLLGLTRSARTTVAGEARLGGGTDLLRASEKELRHVRGRRVGMVFQDPAGALNPLVRVGEQIAEQIRAHERVSRPAARARAVELLGRVGIPQAGARARAYPHELSGGMRQRVTIAMALSCAPAVLVADEPTTALDVTIQAQILGEIDRLRREVGVAVLLITHDLGVVAQIADRVAVMYAGRTVEHARVGELFADPLHPYTWGLLGAQLRRTPDRQRLATIPGSPPSLLDPPPGCHFAARCPHRLDRCGQVPPLRAADPARPDHLDRCFLEPAAKRRLRWVGDGIGLPQPATAEPGSPPPARR